MENEEKIKRAIEVAVRYGGIKEPHHMAWVIDQMVRCLTGCPDETTESLEYIDLIATARDGEDGPETYDWDTGIAP